MQPIALKVGVVFIVLLHRTHRWFMGRMIPSARIIPQFLSILKPLVIFSSPSLAPAYVGVISLAGTLLAINVKSVFFRNMRFTTKLPGVTSR